MTPSIQDPHPEDAALSAWLDGELDADDERRVRAHLDACPACATLAEELRGIVAQARALPELSDRAPEAELWPGIAARIGAAPRRAVPAVHVVRSFARRFSFSLPQLVAASLLVAMISGGGVWWALRALGPRAASAPAQGSSGVEANAADFEIHQYDRAVADLEQVLAHNRSRLDPETVRTVEANLAVIDAAAAQARQALLADPANPYLSGHLAEQMKRKIRVLQRTADAVTADYGGAS